MSSASVASSSRTVFGAWNTNSTSSQRVDLEAQTISGSRLPLPATITPPTPVVARTSRDEGTDPIDDFFGVTRTRGTSDSRHDMPALPALVDQDIEALPPPPYADSSDLPSYTAVAEPSTLAMYLFKFGFLFPLFWLAGVAILFSPLNAPENWEPTKTEAERAELIELLRRTERKWAKRCLVAFLVLSIIVIAIALTAVLVMRS